MTNRGSQTKRRHWNSRTKRRYWGFGIKGDTGATGPKGDGGVIGPKGDVGDPGLKGDDGATGIKGDIGIPGLKGDMGTPGLKGDTGPPGPKGAGTGGVVYVRWDHDSCPSGGAKLVYAGKVGGSKWNNPGGGGNPQCLPLDPNFYKTVTLVEDNRTATYMEQNMKIQIPQWQILITLTFHVLYAMLPPGVHCI